jgi:hypothetical protein
MNNTQKILIAVGVGVGVAYLYNRYKKGKQQPKSSQKASNTLANGSFELPVDNTAVADMSREEKEEFILDNISATPQEVSSGFEGVKFVWNPQIGKMYPVGTIQEGQEPAYADAVFLSAEGDVVADIPESVRNAEKALADLNDQEIELLFRITKKIKENPSIMSEEDAVRELGVTNENIIKVVKEKLKKRLNDIKIMKKDASWKEKWESRKEIRKKRRKDFKEKLGFKKETFDKIVKKQCGRKPMFKSKMASYKKCVEAVADKMRSKVKSEVQVAVNTAPVAVKEEINQERQKSFQNQVTNRKTGGMFAGKRWDGESNAELESKVDKGLI